MKKATVTTWRTASLLVLAAGLALVAFMVLEGELGALPLALVLCVGLSSAAAWKRRPRD